MSKVQKSPPYLFQRFKMRAGYCFDLLVEFEPLTTGDEPVSNDAYETSVLNKIG